MLQPEQGVPIESWFGDMKDKQLKYLIPILIKLSKIHDVRQAVTQFVQKDRVDFKLAKSVCMNLLLQQESAR